MPKPDEENQIRPPRLRFRPGGWGGPLQGGVIGQSSAAPPPKRPTAALTHPPGSSRTASASPPGSAAAPPPAAPHTPGEDGPSSHRPSPRSHRTHPERRQPPARSALQLPHQPDCPLPRHAAVTRARETWLPRSQWEPGGGANGGCAPPGGGAAGREGSVGFRRWEWGRCGEKGQLKINK